MKKLLTLVAVLTLGAGLASANSVLELCSGYGTGADTFSSGVGTITGTCPGLTATLPPGSTLTGMEVYYNADYQFGGSANTVSVTLTASNPTGGGTWGLPNGSDPFICTITGNGSSVGNTCTPLGGAVPQNNFSTLSASSAQLLAASISGFNTSASSTVIAGTVGGSSEGFIVEYDYSLPTPEPSSLIMIGSGLLGIGFMLKRRKA
jgi:hypothetical protein